jgi:hypothetical protein
MLLLRYFLFVGGFLLCALFVADAYLPKQPVQAQKEIDTSFIRVKRNPDEDVSAYPDLFLAIPRKQTTTPAPLLNQTRQAYAAMPTPAKRRAQRQEPDAGRETPHLPLLRPDRPDGFPTW